MSAGAPPDLRLAACARSAAGLSAWLLKWGKRYAKLCTWVEENIEETFSFYRLPRQHYKKLKSTNMFEQSTKKLERLWLLLPARNSVKKVLAFIA